MPPSSFATVLYLLSTLALAHPASIWHVSIEEGPAPPPDEGPPLSAHASRDKSKLKYEIIGIAGAYVFWVLVTLIIVLIAGRRLRRRKNILRRSSHMSSPKGVHRAPQQIKTAPMATTTTSGPISPRLGGRLTSWISPGKGHQHQQSQASVSTVDERVLEADKAKNMDDMTKLYAAVMQQDEEKAQQDKVHTFDAGPLRSPTTGPPELQHLREETTALKPSNQSIATTAVEDDTRTAVASRASSRKTKASPLSFLSHTRTESANSNRSRPSRISFRGQPISNPVGSPGFSNSSIYTDEPPLTPRVYTPGPPPPTPGLKSPAAQAREAERENFQKPQVPPALSLRSAAATNSSGSLPFRQVYADSMKSAPATKTTFLEKRDSILHPAPKTGIPNIPYSPYQPYTPLTPITPHLATKQEMKRNKKKFGGPLTPEDVVPSDEDMWGKMI